MKHTALAQTDKQHDTKRRRLDCDWERGGYSEYDAHDEPDDIDQENWYLDAEDAMQDADTDQHIEDAEQEDTGQEDAQTDAGARERDFCEEGTVYSTTGSTKAHHCVCVLKDSWLRPAVPEDAEILTASAPLLFQQMEADYYLGEEKPGFQRGQTAVLRFHGATAEGYSVLCHVRGVQPYLYIEMPEQMQERDLGWFADVLAREMELRQVPRRRDTAYIRELRVEVLTDLFGYQFDKKKRFIRICTGVPGFIGPLRQLLETGVRLPQLGTSRKFPTYESNIMFVLRAMIDKNIVGSNWLELPAHKYHVLQPGEKTAHSQIEVEISHEHLISHSPDEGAEWSRMAPLRILSFDIECAGRQGHFPEAQHDSVIQIANCVTVQGQPEPIIKNVFTLGTCSSIVGADVHQFWREDTVRKNEIRMLEQWRDFVVAVDPDILTGYNIINFDLPYLLDRARALGIDVFPYLGRIIEHPSAMKDSTFSSKAYGTRESKDINIDGRVQLDVLPAIQRDYKLTSYTLNNVSAHFLKEQKEDVHHSLITVLYNGDGSSADTRRRLAAYCLKDACLPQRLLDKLLIVVNYIEMARVTGIPITWVLTRGQQIRVLSQLLRRCKAEGILVPTPESSSKKNSSNNYEGATVIAPKAGYYDEPIATLDFASLYPSIMIAHNLCYSTLLPKSIILGTDGDVLRTKHGDFAADEHIKTPSGDFFVTRKRHEGVLPRILVYLLAARDAAKKLMKAASSDPFLYAVYNGRQLAIKVVANSVYGFTGAVAGHLPCIPISASVTAFGRDMIMAAAKTVKEEFTIQNGYEHDADVIYGDTDSVMVRFGTKDLAQALALGKKGAAIVSKKFIAPIKLEFEKVYFPYLLITKKRYAGLWWENTVKHTKLDAKGIQMVRRDNSPLVRNALSTALRLMLIDRDPRKAEEYVRTLVSDVFAGHVDISMFIISKSLAKKQDEYGAKQAHVELAERMRRRDPATAPRIGDRVPYVIVKGPKGAKISDRSEDPLYALENNIPIDAEYYINKQLRNPVIDIFKSVVANPESLFLGEHTRVKRIETPKNTGIMRFAKVQPQCLRCKHPVHADTGALCTACKPLEPEIYQQLLNKHYHYEHIYSRMWVHCQRCQGNVHHHVICANNDCPIFYTRKKAQKELKESQAQLDRFTRADLHW